MNDGLSLRPWAELDKEELSNIRDDLWTAQALSRAAYKARVRAAHGIRDEPLYLTVFSYFC